MTTVAWPFRVIQTGGTRTLLRQSDFTHLGWWNMPTNLGGSTSNYANGLALRYVGGNLRIYVAGYGGAGASVSYWPIEMSLNGSPNASTGGSAPTVTQTWNGTDLWGSTGYSGAGARMGIYFDPDGGLWYTSVGDYPQGGYLSTAVNSMSYRVLNSNGTCSGFRGMFGMQNVGARANYGGVRKIPAWFASAHGVGPYMSGFGGYSSLQGQGLIPSLGPFWAFLPDPRNYTDNPSYNDTTPGIATGQYVIGADCRGGNGLSDWYPNYSTRTFDRGVRVSTNVVNYFDGGQQVTLGSGNATFTNGSTAVTFASPQTMNNGMGIAKSSDLDGGDLIYGRVASDIVAATSCTITSPYTGAGGTGAWKYKEFPNAGVHPGTAGWLSPATGDPDGYGRWSWDESYRSNAWWIDDAAGSRTKHGFLCLLTCSTGSEYYYNSDRYAGGMTTEFHVYDPADMASVAAGSLPPYALRPRNAWEVPGLAGQTGGVEFGAQGVAFDPSTNILYVFMTTVTGGSKLHAWSVAAN